MLYDYLAQLNCSFNFPNFNTMNESKRLVHHFMPIISIYSRDYLTKIETFFSSHLTLSQKSTSISALWKSRTSNEAWLYYLQAYKKNMEISLPSRVSLE